MKFDIAIIGGGPGGYTAAEKAAKAGRSVVLFEKEDLGGTCLNRGCMPTKALLHSAETYAALGHAQDLGVQAQEIHYDFAAMHQRKDQVVATLRQGVEKLMKASKVTVVAGQACIQEAGLVTCQGETYEVGDIIIATGSQVSYPPIPGLRLPGVYNSRDILEGGGQNFASLVIVGGGVVGVECATLYRCLGCEVTVLEAADHILPFMDREIAQRLTMILKKQGVKVEAKASVQKIEGTPGAMTVTYTDKKGAEHTVTAQGVLAAAGRKANLEGLFGPDFSLELDRGGIVGDADGRTSVPHVYVIGDAKARNIQLAHVASAQGENAVAAILGQKPALDLSVVPSCVYTNPEIASVGLTEEGAKAAGITVKTGKYLTGANGKCLIEGTESGYVKLVTDQATGRILGAQIVGYEGVDKRIDVLATAMQMGGKVTDLTELDLAYAPPYSSAKDPVNMAGFMAENIEAGLVKQFHWDQVADLPRDGSVTLLDARTPMEYSGGCAQGFVNIPVDELRQRLGEIDPQKPVYVMCQSGLRSYLACRILAQHGYDCYNFSGGYRFYASVMLDQLAAQSAYPCGVER